MLRTLFNFEMKNFPFINKNIPAAHAYGVYLPVNRIFHIVWFLSGFH